MLTYEDGAPIIRHAIIKKLDMERGVNLCDVRIKNHLDCIAVGVLVVLDGDDGLIVRSRFDLPPEFELIQLHNEIDEIAESYKAARVDFWRHGRVLGEPQKELPGTGLRGRWHAAQ